MSLHTLFKRYLVVLLSFLALPVFALSARQQQFVNKLSTLAKKNNARILKTREKLQQYYQSVSDGDSLSASKAAWVSQIAKQYKVQNWQMNNHRDWKKLLSRVDTIPVSMVLAQSAIETAWGTSRFAKQGNNYFGQWCYTKGCGLVPLRRPAGAQYEVQKFLNPMRSVQAYMLNLNTNSVYHALRVKRAQLRAQKDKVTGFQLSAGLSRYSQLGKAYVGIVRRVISRISQ